MGKSRKRLKDKGKPRVHAELKGFDITINSFGEIISTHNIDELNAFLNRHVDDKKLRDRNDLSHTSPEEE